MLELLNFMHAGVVFAHLQIIHNGLVDKGILQGTMTRIEAAAAGNRCRSNISLYGIKCTAMSHQHHRRQRNLCFLHADAHAQTHSSGLSSKGTTPGTRSSHAFQRLHQAPASVMQSSKQMHTYT
jgi:hypothetical protein